MTGVKRWDDKDTYYVQTNNPTENILKKLFGKSWLQSCGPSAAVSGIASIGKPVEIKTNGTYKPQPEEILMDYFNDPINFEKFKQIRDMNIDKVTNNQIPQYYPLAVKEVFNVESIFRFGLNVYDIEKAIKENRSVLCALITPGHYITIVAYDNDNYIYNDPWQQNYYPSWLKGTSGFNRKIKKDELLNNLKKWRVEIG